MDARLDLEEICALREGDAHMLRNAGGLVTDDVLRSLVISSRLLGTQEFAVIQHTACGLLGLDEDEARRAISRVARADTSGLRLLAFSDLEGSVREQVRRLCASPLLPPDRPVSGWVYDVAAGRLREIAVARTGGAAATP